MIRLTAELTLIPTSEGGKTRPITRGYRPIFTMGSLDAATSLFVEVIQGRDTVTPGDTAAIEGHLLSPELFEGRLVPGARFEIREGRSIVGHGVLRSVVESPAPVERALR